MECTENVLVYYLCDSSTELGDHLWIVFKLTGTEQKGMAWCHSFVKHTSELFGYLLLIWNLAEVVCHFSFWLSFSVSHQLISTLLIKFQLFLLVILWITKEWFNLYAWELSRHAQAASKYLAIEFWGALLGLYLPWYILLLCIDSFYTISLMKKFNMNLAVTC